MLDKIKKHRMIIAILTLLIVSNLFTIALFMSNQKDPTMRVNGDAPNETNIIDDSPGSSWFGDVTNNQPVVESEKVTVKNPTKVPVYKTVKEYLVQVSVESATKTYWSEGPFAGTEGIDYVILDTRTKQVLVGYDYK